MSSEKKPPKIKIPGLFRKKYTEKAFQKKILKKLFVSADRQYIEKMFESVMDEKKKKVLYRWKGDSALKKTDGKRLATLAKEIKKQKGRFNLVSIFMAVVLTTALVLVLTVFRNPLAHLVLTSALEGAFGAKSEIENIDFDLAGTRFRTGKLTVADRANPMRNLFEFESSELYFNLLELTRGKLVIENLEVAGLRRGTERTVSGALPPRQQAAFDKKQQAAAAKPNPVTAALNEQIAKASSEISPDSGIAAVKDQLDPRKFLEEQKTGLQAPAVTDEIRAAVPELTSAWEKRGNELQQKVTETISAGRNVTTLKVSEIRTATAGQAALQDVQAALSATSASVALANTAARDLGVDSGRVNDLKTRADAAIRSDSARIRTLADSIRTINLDSGRKLIGNVFDTFMINTLGSFYPWVEKGLVMLKDFQQSSGGDKKTTLKKKSSAIARSSGRTLSFGGDSLPGFVLRNAELSLTDSGISGSASVTNITNNADQLGMPAGLIIATTHGAMSEQGSAVLDLRSGAEKVLDAQFTASGYPLAIASSGQSGVPSISGTLTATGKAAVLKDNTLTLQSDLRVSNAAARVQAFEPAFLYSAYAETLAGIQIIDLQVQAEITPPADVRMNVTTDLDRTINAAMQNQVNRQVERFKADVRREGEAYLSALKSEYSAEISRFTAITERTKSALTAIRNHEKALNDKKKEIEDRIAAIAREQLAPAQGAATDAAKKAADTIKLPF